MRVMETAVATYAALSSLSLATGAIVEVGTLTEVTVDAPLYDPNLSANNGCDPAGCVGDLTRDGDLITLISRWSCKPALSPSGTPCFITYSFADSFTIEGLKIALYKGDTRTSTIAITVDGVPITTWTSSGETTAFEGIDIGVEGQSVEIRGVLANSEWLSIMEVEILVDDGVASGAIEAGTLGTVTASAALYDPRVASANGCDPSGCTAALTRREIMVLPDDTTTVPPTPTPQPASPRTPEPSATNQPVVPVGDLTPVGLIPLAFGGGTEIDRLYAKDGDFSTSWVCAGEPFDPTLPEEYIYADCPLYIDLFTFRHIKQIKIALSDGAENAVDMRLAANKPTYYGYDQFQAFVTSSGTTDGFETYDFDYFTDFIAISGIFNTEQLSISISEVEFVEEVVPGEIQVSNFDIPYDNGDGLWNEATTDGFEWTSDSNEAIDRVLSFSMNTYARLSAMELKFPVGDTYAFNVELFNKQYSDPFRTISDLQSTDTAEWQSFDIEEHLLADEYVTIISIVMKGSLSGLPGFKLLDARFIGTPIGNPTDEFYVGSTFIESWEGDVYPDFVAEGSSNQKAIMAAICAVKKSSFDGVDCVREDATATGTVYLPKGGWYVDGNIFMKSGVFLDGRFSTDDSPFSTDIMLQEGAAGNTDIGPIVVFDGVENARMDDVRIYGLYDPATASSAVAGLGSTCLSITNSKNITCEDTGVTKCDGDGLFVKGSSIINIDAGPYDDQYVPWEISSSRGTGLKVVSSEDIWVRRHTIYDNGVAGIHISGSTNFTFEATIGEDNAEGEGNVGSLDGQQPIEVLVEGSSLVTFQDMKITSNNEPVMTISADSSTVSFNNCGFSNVQSGTCVIQTGDPAVVTVVDDELILVDTCFVKV